VAFGRKIALTRCRPRSSDACRPPRLYLNAPSIHSDIVSRLPAGRDRDPPRQRPMSEVQGGGDPAWVKVFSGASNIIPTNIVCMILQPWSAATVRFFVTEGFFRDLTEA